MILSPNDIPAEVWRVRRHQLDLDVRHVDDERWYRYGKTPWCKSVTTLIGGSFGKPFPEAANAAAFYAANRGTEVHKACHLLAGASDDEELDWGSLDVDVQPRVEAYQRFMKRHRWFLIAAEIPVFSATYEFGGSLDQFGLFEGHYAQIEIKPAYAPTAALQTAAYNIGLREAYQLPIGIRRYRLSLDPKLNEDGFQLRRFVDPLDKEAFIACAVIDKWKRKNKIT